VTNHFSDHHLSCHHWKAVVVLGSCPSGVEFAGISGDYVCTLTQNCRKTQLTDARYLPFAERTSGLCGSACSVSLGKLSAFCLEGDRMIIITTTVIIVVHVLNVMYYCYVRNC